MFRQILLCNTTRYLLYTMDLTRGRNVEYTKCIYMLWHPLTPVAAVWFVASVPSSYMAVEYLAVSFRRHPPSKHETNIHKNDDLQAPCVSDQSRASSTSCIAYIAVGAWVHIALKLNTGVDGRTWVAGREVKSHVHHEKRFLEVKRISSCQPSDRAPFLGPQRFVKNFGLGTYGPIRRLRTSLF